MKLLSIKQFEKHFDSPTIQILFFAVKNYTVHREIYQKGKYLIKGKIRHEEKYCKYCHYLKVLIMTIRIIYEKQ